MKRQFAVLNFAEEKALINSSVTACKIHSPVQSQPDESKKVRAPVPGQKGLDIYVNPLFSLGGRPLGRVSTNAAKRTHRKICNPLCFRCFQTISLCFSCKAFFAGATLLNEGFKIDPLRADGLTSGITPS